MRTVIISLGSRGDVEPYVALGRRMAEAGFEVSVATHRGMHDFVAAKGLAARPVAGDPREILHGVQGQRWLESASNPLRLLSGLDQVMEPIMEQGFHDCVEACRGADLILASRLAVVPGLAIAEANGSICLPAYTLPAFPSGAYPSVFLPFDFSLGRLGNRLSHLLVERSYWRMFRRKFARLRGNGREYPQLPRRVARAMMHGPAILGMSPALVPWAADDPVRPTGFWLPDAGKSWTPPQALLDFLAAGPPPICIGFGSMTSRAPDRLAALVREALRMTGERAVVLSGWGALSALDAEPGILVMEEAPHDWLLPRVSMMVHHGGPGTVAACLRAGIPSIVLPFFADQRFWGGRLYALGVAPRPLPQAKLTAEGFAALIGEVRGDPGYGARARRLGEEMLREDGPGEAIRVIRSMVRR